MTDARCCGCNYTIKNIDNDYGTYWWFELTCDKCGWQGYWDLVEDDGFVDKGMSKQQAETEMNNLIQGKAKRVQKCKCGGKLVENDGHYICECYLEDIKTGIQQQQQVLKELTNGDTRI